MTWKKYKLNLKNSFLLEEYFRVILRIVSNRIMR